MCRAFGSLVATSRIIHLHHASNAGSQYCALIFALLWPRSVRGSPILKGLPASTFSATGRPAHLERSQRMDLPHGEALGIFALIILLRVGHMLAVEEQAPLN